MRVENYIIGLMHQFCHKMDWIFNIENLHCGYNGSTVLEIESLKIPKGKMVLVLGVSGSGKSTLLEAIGLMNNTIRSCSRLDFAPNNHVIDLSSAWDQKKILPSIRKEYFSFMFQNSFLMPHFSPLENIAMVSMIAGKDKKQANKEAVKRIDELGLIRAKESKWIQEISGGEKQRVAFLRGVSSSGQVIFGDEPTGNLDFRNANILFKMISKEVYKQNKTAIIVSHDDRLALEYADVIVVIRKAKNHAIIKDDSVFYRSQSNKSEWVNSHGKIIPEFNESLNDLLYERIDS